MTISGESLAFILLALVAIGGSMLMLSMQKVVHMVVALVFTFLSVAGLYVLLSAEFVAVVQVLIYSGAITIIMLFGIMLTRHNDESEEKTPLWKKALIALGVAGLGGVLYKAVYQLQLNGEALALHQNNTEQIGLKIYSHYVIPFEVMSVLLLVALIGAIVIAKRDKEGQ